MKIRNGFVSNSSSSSFIVSRKRGMSKVTMEIEVDLKGFESEILHTKKELDEYFLANYGYKNCNTIEELISDEDSSRFRKKYFECLDAINRNEEIVIGNVGSENYDNPMELYLYNNGFGNAKMEGMSVIQDTTN